jgi:uncharacterized membrane protein YhaH (DUF805 family)
VDISQLWFGFLGRINRAKYWLVTVVNMLIVVVLFIVAAAANSWAIGILAFLSFVPLFISSLAVGTKRLHDRDKSAWWLIVFYILPSILSGAGKALGDAGLILSLVSLGLSVWALVELGCLRGTAGPNQYGSDPLEGRG